MVLQKIKNSTTKATKELVGLSITSADKMEQMVRKTETEINTYVAPVRETVLKKYPTLFAFLVTIGAVATFLGFEQLILRVGWLEANPWVILLFGLSILFFTGKLYKKLGEL